MSVVTVVGLAVTLALAGCVGIAIYCLSLAPSSGRHALGAGNAHQVEYELKQSVGGVEPVAAVRELETSDRNVVGFGGSNSLSEKVGARPYLEHYWANSGSGLVDHTVEFAAFQWIDDAEWKSASGELVIVS